MYVLYCYNITLYYYYYYLSFVLSLTSHYSTFSSFCQ
nr:MAG TPA: hypothetical protein [Caudoviricetes sp.]